MIPKILAAIATAAAPIIAERLAQELRDALPELADHLVDAVLAKLPDLSNLDEELLAKLPDLNLLAPAVIELLRTALRELFKGLPFPFNTIQL
ncbi:hypothetical protein I5H03_gp006 [Mycobacterium phage Nibb]|uniref:Uncharacterized protein n=1 Tax=Mycobacterium phage Nibb TaxID=2510585 RepID=A0A411B5M1_9CAUD|nr:hypothetical protein I5H03_gp006 [Mycobacterium phage Nibb]QAX95640.1 hypothetical protein SEA_NIBB_101 [Mycobacterium phage Nibb]